MGRNPIEREISQLFSKMFKVIFDFSKPVLKAYIVGAWNLSVKGFRALKRRGAFDFLKRR